MRVIVTGLIGSIPMAGLTLHYLQYALGLRKLGHEVLYLEDTGSWYYHPDTDAMVDDASIPLGYLNNVMAKYGLENNWVFVDLKGGIHGLSIQTFKAFVRSTDVFINVTGAGLVRESYRKIPHRIYIDTDPGYIQMRVDQGSQKDLEHLGKHTTHFSFGCNIGKHSCNIPNCGFNWHPTVQPIVMDLWPFTSPPDSDAAFTTVLKWQTYEPVKYHGKVYGLKNMEFKKFVELPSLITSNLEIAMVGNPPVDNLAATGWMLRDARSVSTTISQYRSYIRSSRGEWSIAKNGYVASGSGWFGDRSAAYLASGRPVLLQNTGYDLWLETGCGLLPFTTLNEAAAALESVNGEYTFHCLGARRLAEEYFDSRKVLQTMLAKVGV